MNAEAQDLARLVELERLKEVYPPHEELGRDPMIVPQLIWFFDMKHNSGLKEKIPLSVIRRIETADEKSPLSISLERNLDASPKGLSVLGLVRVDGIAAQDVDVTLHLIESFCSLPSERGLP